MGYFYPYLLAFGAVVGLHLGGPWVWLGLVLTLGVNTLLDEVVKDHRIHSGIIRRLIFHVGFAEGALRLSFPFLVVFLGYGLWHISKMTDWLEILGSVLSVGVLMGVIAINAAHELVHRRSIYQRAEGILNLALVNFCWWRISHIEIHHRYVGTHKDPATAYQDEKVWAFWLRNFWGNLKGTWQLEKNRSGLSFSNAYWTYFALFVTFALLVFALGSLSGSGGLFLVLIWLAISIVAILMLQSVDYIEHKGLVRSQVTEGRFEPVRAQHSWDSYYLFTNLALFNLGFHSHHHMKASVEFQHLAPSEGAKLLPGGYAKMVLKSLVGLW
jgi:alkane 1-monooxygenase